MNLADAYPNSALSVGALMAIAFTMAIVLAIWLIMVFRADGKPQADGKPEADSHPKVAEPAATSEDKHNDRGQAQAGRREGVSA
jgi:sugar phosphate permease